MIWHYHLTSRRHNGCFFVARRFHVSCKNGFPPLLNLSHEKTYKTMSEGLGHRLWERQVPHHLRTRTPTYACYDLSLKALVVWSAIKNHISTLCHWPNERDKSSFYVNCRLWACPKRVSWVPKLKRSFARNPNKRFLGFIAVLNILYQLYHKEHC